MSPIWNINKMLGRVYGIHVTFSLWTSCKLSFIVDQYFWKLKNFLTTYGESDPYWISEEPMKRLMECIERSILYISVNRPLLWISVVENRNCLTTSLKFPYVRFSENVPSGLSADARSSTDRQTWPLFSALYIECLVMRPPLCSSGQSSWVRFSALPDFLRSCVSGTGITEKLLEWKSSDSESRKFSLTTEGIRCADQATPSIRKSWHWLRRQAAVAGSV
jgi:hypothetical protein